jgi:hypothetical integral membrane protein (TIGR02206 family)
MRSIFDANEPNSFQAYSTSHWIALLIFVIGVLLLYLLRNWLKGERRSKVVRYGLALVLVLSEVSLNVWYVAEGVYRVKDTLPLELCSISLYFCVFMLLFRSRFLFQIVYFTGIGGALQALLTPVLGYPFPHYRFIEFFIAHITIIIAVLFMVWVEGYRPTLKSIAITMGFLNVMLVIIVGVNYLTGGNYMFLARKPDTASLLDVLGPYPWYLLSLEAVALVLFLLLYAPFSRSSRTGNANPSRNN